MSIYEFLTEENEVVPYYRGIFRHAKVVSYYDCLHVIEGGKVIAIGFPK